MNTFTYNGDGQRVQKQDSTGTTKHVWDGQNILLETDGSNIIQVVYTLEPTLYGNLISQRRSGTTSFYLFDGLGSTTQLANSTGSVTDSYLYDSFGNILADKRDDDELVPLHWQTRLLLRCRCCSVLPSGSNLQPWHRAVFVAQSAIFA